MSVIHFSCKSGNVQSHEVTQKASYILDSIAFPPVTATILMQIESTC